MLGLARRTFSSVLSQRNPSVFISAGPVMQSLHTSVAGPEGKRKQRSDKKVWVEEYHVNWEQERAFLHASWHEKTLDTFVRTNCM